MSILVADGNEESRKALTCLLEEDGYEVIAATNGAEVLQLARRSPPDIVLTDILMPVVDGFELCRRWKQDEHLKRIPLVVYTATYTDPKDERLALDLGADRFLIQPQPADALLPIVREILERTRRDPDSVRCPRSDNEVELLQLHNEALGRRLEKKVRELEAEIARRSATEADLRESERRFRVLAENARDVVWSMDLDGRFTYLSPAVQKLRGYTPLEVQERPPLEVLGSAAVDLIGRELHAIRADIAAGGRLDRNGLYEIELPCKDGGSVWTEVSAILMRDETERPVGVQGVTRDISARKRAEEEMRSALEKLARKTRELEGLLSGATAILAGQDFPTTARAIFENARALTGAEVGHVAVLSESGDQNELAFFEPGGVAVDSNMPMSMDLREVCRTGKVVCHNGPMNGGHSGSVLPHGHAEVRNILSAPLSVDGETVGVLCLGNKPGDFNDDDKHVAAALGKLVALGLQRWRAAQMLKESESLLRIAGRMARLGGWSADLKVMRMSWSDEVAAIHDMPAGCSPTVAEAFGFYASEWQHRIESVFEACAREGTPYDEEMEILTARGARIWVRTSGEAIRDASGTIRKVQGAFQDITDRKQAEAERQKLQNELFQSQKIESIGRLAGGVAHDFNNLLAVVLSYASFAIASLPEDHPLRAVLEEIRRAGERAAVLTRQLLAFGRNQILNPEVLCLNRVVKGLESMLRRLLGEDIELALDLADALGRIRADAGQLEQLIVNLAVNARDAMPRGGRLTIETANVEMDSQRTGHEARPEPGPFVMLSVTDNGTGMDAMTKEHAFEPFFTTKETGKGTGLGLSTVYGIVKQSGGSISLYSELGQGTTFTIYLPRVDTPLPPTRPKDAAAMRAVGSETVLIVENEDAVRRIAEHILREAGYTVLAAAGGAEALLIGEEHGGSIDLLLTDVVMPKMGGPELAQRLVESNPQIRVLYMSGHADSAIVHNCLLDPGTRFLAKPFSAADLTYTVRDVLDGTPRGRLPS